MRKLCLLASAASLQLHAKLFSSLVVKWGGVAATLCSIFNCKCVKVLKWTEGLRLIHHWYASAVEVGTEVKRSKCLRESQYHLSADLRSETAPAVKSGLLKLQEMKKERIFIFIYLFLFYLFKQSKDKNVKHVVLVSVYMWCPAVTSHFSSNPCSDSVVISMETGALLPAVITDQKGNTNVKSDTKVIKWFWWGSACSERVTRGSVQV